MHTPTIRQVLEADVASVLVSQIKWKSETEWVRIMKYEALYFVLGRMTEDEMRAGYDKLMYRWRYQAARLSRDFAAGMEWLKQQKLPPTVEYRDGVFFSAISMKTGKPFERTGRESGRAYGKQKRTVEKEQREAEFPAVKAGDPKLEEFHQELIELRRNGEPVHEWWDGTMNDSLRILSSFRAEYVQRCIGPLGACLIVGVIGDVGRIVKKLFPISVDAGPSIEESSAQ